MEQTKYAKTAGFAYEIGYQNASIINVGVFNIGLIPHEYDWAWLLNKPESYPPSVHDNDEHDPDYSAVGHTHPSTDIITDLVWSQIDSIFPRVIADLLSDHNQAAHDAFIYTILAAVAGHLLPDAPNARNLGSTTKEWNNLYLALTAYFGMTQQANLYYDNVSTSLKTDNIFNALALLIGGTSVITAARVLENVTANASIITAGIFNLARIPNMDWAHISGLFPRVIGDVISAAFSRTWISDFFDTFFNLLKLGTTGATSDVVLETGIETSWTPYFRLTAGGELQWLNPATGVKDCNLYRAGANLLATYWSFAIQDVLYIDSHCNLYQLAEDVLATDDALVVSGNHEVGNANYNIRLCYDTPKIHFGDRSGAFDTNLYRSAANVLRTNDSLIVDLTLTISGALLANHANVRMNSLPTSDPHIAGYLWKDGAGGTTVRISIG